MNKRENRADGFRSAICQGFELIFVTLAFLIGAVPMRAQDANPTDPTKAVVNDTLLEHYSVEELLEFKKYYQSQIRNLEKNKKVLSETALKEGEAFLKQHPESKVRDKVYMRLGEMYYLKATEGYLLAEQHYDSLMTQFEQGTIPERPVAPQKDFTRSLQMYENLIQEFPHSQLIDDALYNKAFVLEESGKIEDALKIYQQVIDEFPDSPFVAEALMRQAEYQFNPPVNSIENAIEVYKKVLYYKDSPRYDEALYRLGWSYYRLNMYPEAVAYFTLLADDLERTRHLDPNQKYSNPALREESVEYIGISFLDYGGVEGAATYLKDIGGRGYGLEILQKIGDAYLNEKEEYEHAIQAYQTLLNMYPVAPTAPQIQAKIVQCYRNLEDDMSAHLARKALFENYRPESSWWQKVTAPEARQQAHLLSEQALRENLNQLLQRAGEINDQDLYRQFVIESHEYLKVFPKDTNAALIHWNMALTLDMKLRDYPAAFENYMQISERYWSTKFQKYAAENAIALAKETAVNTDSLAQLGRQESKNISELHQETPAKIDLATALQHPVLEMKPADQRLATAYDNYIMLFPHEKVTAVMLANAGALYYNHNDFEQALKYFNTLVRHFPDGKDVDYARYTIMECYFGKQDYASCEVVAKTIRQTSGTPEIVQKANKRLAEAIFLAAKILADSGSHLKAGNEFVRVVVEVPGAKFSDLALFNGASQYDEAHEFRRAVETYEYLVENFSKSKYRLDAMNNMALDYGELNEFRNAAISYEKLAQQHPDSGHVRDALYNASVFYARTEDWKSAIRVNKDFVRRFPHSTDADNLYFDMANYHLKLNELAEANEIYGEFANKYPNSSRGVETYFKRGEYYQANQKFEDAKQQFTLAVQRSESLQQQNLDPNNYFAAEALFAYTELMFNDFRKINLVGTAAQVEEAKKLKKAILIEMVEKYTRVARYGTIRLYQATYKIGLAYEDFAATWARQEIPGMEATQKAVALREVNQVAVKLYERAETSFLSSVEALTRIADDFEASIKNKAAVPAAGTTSDTTKLKGGRITLEDSTLYVARRWIEYAKEKISEIIYSTAELNHESVSHFLKTPIPAELTDAGRLEYQNQVINRAIRPMVEEIIATHTRNVKVANDLKLTNQWVQLSKRKIVETGNILAQEYQQMTATALKCYYQRSEEYLNLVKTNADAGPVADQLPALIDFANAFSRAAVQMLQTVIVKGREQSLEDAFIIESENQMLKTVYTNSMVMDSLAHQSNSWRKQCEQLFKTTDKVAFEEATYFFEDKAISLKEAKKSLLETGYQIASEMGLASTWTNSVIFELVKTAPESYGNLMELNSATLRILSGADWKVAYQYQPDWIKIEYQDSSWLPATVMGEILARTGVKIQRIGCLKPDTVKVLRPALVADDVVVSDSNQVTASSGDTTRTPSVEAPPPHDVYEYHSVPAPRAFFRKSFVLNGLPVSGDILITADDSYDLFLNGEYLAASNANTSDWQTERVHRLNEFLRMGVNLLALEINDADHSGHGLSVAVNLTYLPEWSQKQKQFKFRMLDPAERNSLLFNKNIIVY
ncbi:tetratricopeptide repeat protein [candidate division KSB1 bacterium]|nr:tetratricopeptide repeat protein [candidate division KSB1 bacterium]